MATKLGYVERQATNNIDWSAIGSQVVQTLALESKVRQEKKDAIAEASREAVNVVRNSPVGENQTINDFTLNYAKDAEQLLLQQDKLLQSGLLQPRDYSIVRANLNESTDALFALSKEYQAEYDIKMARLKSNVPGESSQDLEAFMMESVEGLSNIKNSKAIINPETGVVTLGMWSNGEMDTDPSSYATVNEVRNRLKSKYDRYDVSGEVNNAVTNLGGYQYVEIFEASGAGSLNKILTTEDATGRDGYLAWEEETVSSMMSNKFNVTSMLTNTLNTTEEGMEYDFTWDREEFENDKTGKWIFLDRSEGTASPVPVFQDVQIERVKEALSNDIRQQIEFKETATVSTKGYPPQRRPKSDDEYNYGQVSNMMNYLYGGNAAQVATAEQYFKGVDDQISNVTRGPEGIKIEYLNGASQTVKLGIGKGNSFQPFEYNDFVGSASTILTGRDDLNISELEAGTPMSYSTTRGKGAGASEGAPPASGYVEPKEVDPAPRD
jgi:hypothetical protein